MDERTRARVADAAPAVFALYDLEHNIQWANAAYCEAAGQDPDEIVGQKCWEALGFGGRCRGCPAVTAVETGAPAEAELTPWNQDHWPAGRGAWLVRATPLRDADGAITGVVTAKLDIAELVASRRGLEAQAHDLGERVKELECLLRLSEEAERSRDLDELLQGAVELLPAGWHYAEITVARIRLDDREVSSGHCSAAVAVQSSDIVVDGAARGRVEVGYLEDREPRDEGPFLRQERDLIDAVGRMLALAIGRIEAENELRAANQQLEASNQQLQATEQQLRASNQQLQASNQQLQASNQQLQATEQQLRAANQALEANEELLNETGEMARVGGWEIDLDTDTVRWTRTTKAIHEVPDDHEPSLEEAIDFFPDCRDELTEAIRRAREEGVPYDMEVPFTTAKGRKLWVHTIGRPEFRDGSCVRLHGTFQDITARRQADLRFRTAQDLSPDGFTILRPVRDASGRVVDFVWMYENAAVARLNGTDPEAVVGQRLLELFPGHRDTAFFEAYQRVAETGEPYAFEESYSGESITTPTWFRIVVVPMDEDIAILAQDITERKHREHQIQASNQQLRAANQQLRATEQQLRASNQQLEAANQQLRATEDTLRTVHDKLRDAQYLAAIGSFTWEIETGRVTWSEGMYRLLQYDPAETVDISKVNEAVHHPDDLERVTDWLTQGIESKATHLEPNEYRLVRKNGDTITVRVNVRIEREKGAARRLFGTCQDITERKAAEEALRESKMRLQLAMKSASQGVWEWDFATGLVTFDDVALRMVGHEADFPPQPGEWWIAQIHAEDRPAVEKAYAAFVDGETETYGVEFRLATRGDDYIWVASTARVVRSDEQGKPLLIVGIHRDITEAKQAEAVLRASEEKYRQLVDNAPIMLGVVDGEGKYQHVNEAVHTNLGYSRDELLDTVSFDLIHQDDLDAVLNAFSTLRTTGAAEAVYRFKHKNGQFRTVSSRASTIPGTDTYFLYSLDITEHKAAEEERDSAFQQLQASSSALELSEAKYRTLVESSLQGVVIAQDGPVRLRFANAAMESVTGYSVAELTSMGPPELAGLIHEDDRERFFGNFQRRVAGDAVPPVAEYRIRRKDGATTWTLCYSSTIDYLGDPATLTTFVDVTERKQAEESLRRFEWLDDKEQLDPRAAADPYEPPYGDVTALNTCRVVRDAVGAETLASMARDLMDLLDTSVAVYEANGDYAFGVFDSDWCRRLDSASFARCRTDDAGEALRCGAWLCHENCWNDSARAAIRSGAPTDIECVGGIRLHAEPIRAGGEVVGAINIGYGTPPRDEATLRALAARFELPLDELREAARAYKPRPQFIIDVAKRRCGSVARMLGAAVEKARLEAQLAQADRLSSMGTLAAGVAHEINNPLAYTLYNLETVVEELPGLLADYRRAMRAPGAASGGDDAPPLAKSPAELDELLGRAREAHDGAQRIRSITRTLGTFARVDDAREGPCDLRHAIEHARNMARNEAKYRAQLQLDLQPVPLVQGAEGKLAQVFLNLLINAAHAIDEGDVEGNAIRIRTYAEGDRVVAEVSDTGKGIPREHLGRLFEPFFTTKPVGEGSGLGLSVSRKIVTELGGEITCESEEGRGSTFRIRLPALPEAADERPADEAPTAPATASNGGRILVVDDEAPIRSLMGRMLGRDGHEVVTASSGAEGREVLAADPGFDLIILDLMMPEVSGMDLHRWLAEHHPELAERVVFVTGGVFTPKARDYLAGVDNLRFDKPLDTASFRKIVGELVVSRRGGAAAD